MLLMSEEQQEAGVSVEELSERYLAAHALTLNPCEYGFLSLSELLKSLPYLVELYREDGVPDGAPAAAAAAAAGGGAPRGEDWVRLTRLYQFARGVRGLLHTYHYNQIFLTEFSSAYCKFTGRALVPRAYGYSSVDDLLGAVPQVVWIKGHGHKRIIVLKNDMKARPSSAASDPSQPEGGADSQSSSSPTSLADSGTGSPGGDDDVVVESELLYLSSPLDLLCGPAPSCLPSPQLHPRPAGLHPHADLIHFERSPPPPPHCTEHWQPAEEAPPPAEEAPPPAEEATPPSEGEGPAPDHQQPANPPRPPAGRSAESPSRRASRGKIRLAANFSFQA
ncbi:unnamed protein product [Arctogadus glacialis]